MRKLLFVAIILFSSANYVLAFPGFFKIYKKHPKRNPEFNNCGTCHVYKGGGGERNEFGEEFARQGFAITEELIKKFPDRFVK